MWAGSCRWQYDCWRAASVWRDLGLGTLTLLRWAHCQQGLSVYTGEVVVEVSPRWYTLLQAKLPQSWVNFSAKAEMMTKELKGIYPAQIRNFPVDQDLNGDFLLYVCSLTLSLRQNGAARSSGQSAWVISEIPQVLLAWRQRFSMSQPGGVTICILLTTDFHGHVMDLLLKNVVLLNVDQLDQRFPKQDVHFLQV